MLRSLFVLSIACIVPCVGLAFVDSSPQALPEANAPADAPADFRAYLVQVAVTQKEGDVAKALFGGTVTVQEGYDCSFVSGGTAEEFSPGVSDVSTGLSSLTKTHTDFFSGSTVIASVGKPKDGLLPVSMRCKIGNLVDTGNPQIRVVSGEFASALLNVKPGEKTEFRIHGNTWCEIRVEQLPQQK